MLCYAATNNSDVMLRRLPLCNHNSHNLLDMQDNHLNIIVLGDDQLASELVSEIQVRSTVFFLFQQLFSAFDTVAWVVWPIKTLPKMTYSEMSFYSLCSPTCLVSRGRS